MQNDQTTVSDAARLRKETILPIKAIAQRVHLGSTKTANTRLNSVMKGPNHASEPQAPSSAYDRRSMLWVDP